MWCQERDNACGPSCMIMAYQRITNEKPQDESLFYEAYNLYGNDTKAVADGADSRITSGFEYTYATNLATAMSKFIGKATAKSYGRENVAQTIFSGVMGHKTLKPVIGLVNWSGGGGHFVLIDKITMHGKHMEMCVCDPWDGCVHVIGAPLGGAMPYRPTYGTSVKTTLGPGANPVNIQTGGNRSVGDFNGWLITMDN
jgi:hypothetical protein